MIRDLISVVLGLTLGICTALAFNAGETKLERTCPKQSSDGLILAYATYEGSKLTCTYVPHTRGLSHRRVEE